MKTRVTQTERRPFHRGVEMQGLKEKEEEIGLVTTEKPGSTGRDASLPPTLTAKDLKKWNGMDIVRKGTARKSRYLFVLPATLSATQGGKLGEITKMDTENPVLYIDFPQGRLKCIGRVTKPEARYLPLKFESKAITCKDIINTVIIFSEVAWVGKAEENPDEKTLPLPLSLAKKVEGSAGDVLSSDIKPEEATTGDAKAQPASTRKRPARESTGGGSSTKKRRRSIYAESTDDSEEEEEDEDESSGKEGEQEDDATSSAAAGLSQEKSESRGHLRRSASQRVRYVDEDDEGDSGDGSGSDNDRADSNNEDDDEDAPSEEGADEDDDDDDLEVIESRSSKRKTPSGKSGGGRKVRRQAASSDEEDDDDDFSLP